jgi:hypothetical protein
MLTFLEWGAFKNGLCAPNSVQQQNFGTNSFSSVATLSVKILAPHFVTFKFKNTERKM